MSDEQDRTGAGAGAAGGTGGAGSKGAEAPPFQGLRQEMDRLFDDLFATAPFALLRRRQLDADPWRRLQSVFDATAPVVDVFAGEGGYRLVAELPGLRAEDLDIAVSNGVLTIKGHKQQAQVERQEEQVLAERRYGAFQRSFPLPDDADPERIGAELKDGLLTVTVPRRDGAPAGRRRIEVTAG
ncbi:Hsp20/alpha crystallin family protein [Geminicoccus harenae]|uniref:Hsp20/alpha crystallin family protein n=2 Tax=Geminicoccus harenae TaxID=2498453 RepID=UPI001C9573B2|nr:Hsp20/alpha crystallin family protein [Geminicoccus harenae]